MSELNSLGIGLYAVVHEDLGIDEFRNYFKGQIFLDKERVFYGPNQRRMMWTGLLRINTYTSLMSAKRQGIEGNIEGEGNVLGGVFVIGPGEQGIVLQQPNMDSGSKADVKAVMEAASQMQKKKDE